MKAVLADPCCIAFIVVAILAAIVGLARYVYSRLNPGKSTRCDITHTTL